MIKIPREKIAQNPSKEVIYSSKHWKIFDNLRSRAKDITSVLAKNHLNTLTYGSIARGDIHSESDIDIVIKEKISSYRLELFIENTPFRIIEKSIIQATPSDVIKCQYELEENITLNLLLTSFTQNAFEFYQFGGALTNFQLTNNKRTPGVDKRLVLIRPTPNGHLESPLLEMRYEASKILDISQSMVDQRIRVLMKRDKIGRTGVFLHRALAPKENVEQKLREIAKENSLVRRRLEY